VEPAIGAFGIGLALAGAPGPVQAVLMGEAVRGGVARGFRALAGVHVTFGALLVALALGLSVSPPHGDFLRALRIAGGILLLVLAGDGMRTAAAPAARRTRRRSLPAGLRGSLAILLNPGGWLFLAAVASPLLATATHRGGVGGALVAATALVAGAAVGDAGVVVVGGLGIRRAGERVVPWVRRGLALVLAVAGVWLIVAGTT